MDGSQTAAAMYLRRAENADRHVKWVEENKATYKHERGAQAARRRYVDDAAAARRHALSLADAVAD